MSDIQTPQTPVADPALNGQPQAGPEGAEPKAAPPAGTVTMTEAQFDAMLAKMGESRTSVPEPKAQEGRRPFFPEGYETLDDEAKNSWANIGKLAEDRANAAVREMESRFRESLEQMASAVFPAVSGSAASQIADESGIPVRYVNKAIEAARQVSGQDVYLPKSKEQRAIVAQMARQFQTSDPGTTGEGGPAPGGEGQRAKIEQYRQAMGQHGIEVTDDEAKFAIEKMGFGSDQADTVRTWQVGK